MTKLLDSEKVATGRKLLAGIRKNTKPVLRSVMELGGWLNWASEVVDGGRIYSQRIWRVTRGVTNPNNRIRLTREFFLDVDWWDENLEKLNGRPVPLAAGECREIVRCVTDATGTGKIGIWMDGAFVHITQEEVRELCPEIPPAESLEKEIHVQTWEAAAPLCVLRLFPLVTEGRELHVLTDNSAAEAALNSGAIRHEPSMAVVRATFWECKRQNARLRVGWLPGKANIFADAVSRMTNRAKR